MLKEFIYLFLIDPSRIPHHHDYKRYAKTEPGYGACMLQAYVTAFSTKKDGIVTEELIKAVHKSVMSFSPSLASGKYKKDHNNYPVFPHIRNDKKKSFSNCHYSVTEQGIREFLNFWFVNNDKPIHDIVFEHQTDKLNFPNYGISYHPQKGFIFYSVLINKKERTQQTISIEKAISLFMPLLADINYQCEVNIFTQEEPEKLAPLSSQVMKKLTATYQVEITKAQSSDEKIATIVTFVQHINQLHPFYDGNIRTCYILLNKLLRDNGLPLSLLMNPNRLDMCSVSELVAMVKQGQEHYQKVTQHTTGNLILESEKEVDDLLRNLNCFPQYIDDIDDSLINTFVKLVINGELISYPSTNPSSVFNLKSRGKNSEFIEKFIKQLGPENPGYPLIQKAINERKFSFVFRIACAHFPLPIIEMLLEASEELGIDLNERSSNKKTGSDWLKDNKNLNAQEREILKGEIENLMESKFELIA